MRCVWSAGSANGASLMSESRNQSSKLLRLLKMVGDRKLRRLHNSLTLFCRGVPARCKPPHCHCYCSPLGKLLGWPSTAQDSGPSCPCMREVIFQKLSAFKVSIWATCADFNGIIIIPYMDRWIVSSGFFSTLL